VPRTLPPHPNVLILTPTDFTTAAASPTSVLDWVRSPNGQQQGDHGSCAAALLPTDDDLVLVLPPRTVSWHRVALPKVAAARLRAALDGVLEDRLLNDPAELHFALEPGRRSGQTLWVAACHKTWLKSWLQVLEAAGRPVSRIVPALWPTSAGGGDLSETVHWAHDEGDGVWLATANPLGVRSVPLRENSTSTFGPASTFGDSTFGDLGPAASSATGHLPTDSDPATTRWFADPSIIALAEQVCNQRFDLMPPPAWLLRCAQSDWNLAQFDLSLSSGARRNQRLRQSMRQFRSAPAWRPARWGLVALLLSLLGGLNAMAWMERSAMAAKQEAMTQALRKTFPDETLVMDAPVQMRRALARLQQASGTLSTSDLEAMLAAVAAVAPSAAPTAVDFTAGDARLGAWNVPEPQLQALQQALNERGWSASLENGSLRIRPKAP
jgi:general secretion pathway protein L